MNASTGTRVVDELQRLGAWPVRAVWLVLPLVAGPSLGEWADDRSSAVQLVAAILMWVAWAIVLVATLVPTTVSLTALRIVAPAVPLACALAGFGGPGDVDLWDVVALSWATVTVAVAFLPSVGATFVNGSSYGDELRLPLRIPGALLLGPVPLAWLATVAGVTAGPMLLAAEQFVAGGLAVAAGLPLAWWGARVLHTLSRRWTVFVPGGLVLHDPLALADPVLFRRGTVVTLGPALAGTQALDLTCGALGLAIEARFAGPVSLVQAQRGPGRAAASSSNEAVQVDAVLFTPTQPGAFLASARSRSVIRG